MSGQTHTLYCTVNETISGLTNSPTLEWVDELGMLVSGDDVMVMNITMTDNSATQTYRIRMHSGSCLGTRLYTTFARD